MAATATTIRWALRGQGYEYCNCDFGCGCNFGGFPNSKDGSCRALVGLKIASGTCGDANLSGVKCAAIVDWPKAIHEGNGKCVFVVDPATTDKQIDALAQIFTGKLGGMPWELLGPTFAVVGLEKAPITIEGTGRKSVFRAEGIGEGRGDTFKNPSPARSILRTSTFRTASSGSAASVVRDRSAPARAVCRSARKNRIGSTTNSTGRTRNHLISKAGCAAACVHRRGRSQSRRGRS